MRVRQNLCIICKTYPQVKGGIDVQLNHFLTVGELAEYLRIGKTSAYELARRPDFPKLRIGRTIRIPRDAMMAWLSGLDDQQHVHKTGHHRSKGGA